MEENKEVPRDEALEAEITAFASFMNGIVMMVSDQKSRAPQIDWMFVMNEETHIYLSRMIPLLDGTKCPCCEKIIDSTVQYRPIFFQSSGCDIPLLTRFLASDVVTLDSITGDGLHYMPNDTELNWERIERMNQEWQESTETLARNQAEIAAQMAAQSGLNLGQMFGSLTHLKQADMN